MRGDVIIIGSGIAAMQLANMLSRDFHVMIITKSTMTTSNSYLAQGGIAAALSDCDHWHKHYRDTLEAGRYHNNEEAVALMTKEAPSLIKELLNEGTSFDRDENGAIKLGLEGAHSEKRIVHGGGDATGKVVIDFLTEKLNHVDIYEHTTVYDLIINGGECIGVRAKDRNGTPFNIYGDHVVIATGGIGQIYRFTSNAETISGDGIALAYRAGAEVADMEFIQFHPTLIYANGKGVGLASEAIRGEGAKLVTDDGTLIMEHVHPYQDLAPRHVVSQTIDRTMKQGRNVYLDITMIDHFAEKFPTVASICKKNGIDVSHGKIPVAPGCHFLMGGIVTDLHGRTTIPRLYAIGEAACTGVHGANRLASNSLLEGLFFGKQLASFIHRSPMKTIKKENKRKQIKPSPKQLPDISVLKNSMMERVSIVRTEELLEAQLTFLEGFGVKEWLEADLEHLSLEETDRVFMLISSWLITKAALKRTESRGGHLRADFPHEEEKWKQKIIIQQRKSDRIASMTESLALH